MRDKVELKVRNRVLRDFVSYEVDSDLYSAASAFSVAVPHHSVDVAAGDRFELWVNDALEMSGLLDVVRKGYSRAGRRTVIEGRDLMGLLCDSYCESFVTVKSKTLSQIAAQILAPVPFISRVEISYDEISARLDSARLLTQIEPGTRKFDALREVAFSRGLLFYCRPDGTFLFGKPRGKGPAKLSILVTPVSNLSDVIDSEYSDDLSQRYSKITVMGQRQGTGDLEPGDINVTATVQDDTFPFYKPYVEVVNEDEVNPRSRARKILEEQRALGRLLSYTVRGHSQNGRNWSTDELVGVSDGELGVHGTMLIYRRTFRLSREGGATTAIALGEPGIVA